MDRHGRDLSAVKALALADRYYLLIKILKRLDAWHPWIYERCREVEAAPDGYIDIWFREGYKSTLTTYCGVIQEVLRDREITVGIFSHTKPIAKAFLNQIKREFEANEALLRLFPEVLYERPDKQSPSWSLDAGIIVRREGNPKEGTIEAHGLVDGQPTSRHFKLMVFDDVVTMESVNTPDQIVKTTEAWSMADNLGMSGGRKWHQGTRYHFADTYQEIINRGAAIARIHAATDDGKAEGRPVLLTKAEWERKKRDQLPATLACQMLCNPLAGSQRMFDVRDLQVYEARPRTLMGYLLCDPARSNKKTSANTAMVVIGIDVAGNKYLLDGFDHQMDLMERWTRLRDLQEKWAIAPGMVGLVVGYESFGAQADLDYFRERQRVERIDFEIVELAWPRDSEGSKVDRIQRLVPDIRGHRFYLPYPTEEERLTKLQRSMIAAGYEYRVAQPILRMDNDGVIYDVAERLKIQISLFPFGGKVDLIDATARIYDAAPVPPDTTEQQYLEPEIV